METSGCNDVKQVDNLTDESTGQLEFSPYTKFHLYGTNETQATDGGEADLHKLVDDCKKNPGHPKFIPIETFQMQHLPDDFHDNDLYEWIKSTADLTVRVSVKMTSPNRPEFYPDTNISYPFYNMRNQTTLRLGTGEIQVIKYNEGHGVDPDKSEFNLNGEKYSSLFDVSTRTCPCKHCKQSDKPNNVWWEIIMTTAAHVVYDDIEADNTSYRLFFDGQDAPKIIIDEVSIHNVNVDADRCRLKYLTCGPLGEKLFNMSAHRSKLLLKIWDKYKNKTDVKLNFIVSHPHGYHKQVSFGHLVKNYEVGEFDQNYNRTTLTYTTCTCPGSSGAPVYCVGSDNRHYHYGVLDSGVNYSCEGVFSK